MDKLNEHIKQSSNQEGERKGVIEGTKNTLKKLFSAVVIAGVISGTAVAKETVSSYSQIQKLTIGMKAGDKITLQVKSGNIDSIEKKLEKDGFTVKTGPNGKIIIVKKQEEEDSLAGWGDVDADMKKIDEKTHKEAEQAKKEAEQAKKQLALVSYGNKIATNLNNLLDFNQSKKEVLEILDRTFLATNNLKQGYFYETTQDEINLRIQELEQIKSHYKSDNKIIKKINDIIKIFNKYNENH